MRKSMIKFGDSFTSTFNKPKKDKQKQNCQKKPPLDLSPKDKSKKKF